MGDGLYGDCYKCTALVSGTGRVFSKVDADGHVGKINTRLPCCCSESFCMMHVVDKYFLVMVMVMVMERLCQNPIP